MDPESDQGFMGTSLAVCVSFIIGFVMSSLQLLERGEASEALAVAEAESPKPTEGR